MPTMKYDSLKERITNFEVYQQFKLKSQLSNINPFPGICTGQVQFASVENIPGGGDAVDLPVVVGIGINYGQGQC